MRSRAAQGLAGDPGSQNGAARTDTGSGSATKPEPVEEIADSGGRQVAESETVVAKAVIDGTDVADNRVDSPVDDTVDDPVDDPVDDTADAAVGDTVEVTVDEVPSSAPDAEAEPTETTEEATEANEAGGSGGKRRRLVAFVLLGLTVVFAVLAFWFYSEVNALRNEGPAANHALSDPAATSEVNGQITNAVQQTFSYDFANTAKTENAAKSLLVGSAIQQYNDLYSIVKQLAPQQKLVLTTTVRASAVTQLQGDRAQVLVFVDQNDTRTDTGQSNSDTGQISIGAVKQGNQWKIDQIEQR